jgi:hypothetical protein
MQNSIDMRSPFGCQTRIRGIFNRQQVNLKVFGLEPLLVAKLGVERTIFVKQLVVA